MPADPKQTETYLRSLNTSDRARAAAFDAVHNADDAAAQRLLEQLPFSDEVKAELWDLRAGGTVSGGTAPKPASPDDYTNQAPQPEGSAAGRFLSNAGQMLNPIAAAKGIAGAVQHPIDTATNIYNASADQYQQAKDNYAQGRYSEAIGHGLGVIPLIGPAAAGAGEQIAAGDIAGGLGKAVGMLAPFAVKGALEARVASKARAGAPAILERQAEQQVAERVLAPGNPKFKGRAQHIAPEILKRGMKGGREELAQAADEGAAASGQAIDDAITAGGGPQAGVIIDPIVAQLRRRIDDLSINGEPIRGAEGRVAGLQARIDQLERVARQRQGLVPANEVPRWNPRAISFENLRKFRDEQYRLADEARAYQRMGNPTLSDEGFAAAESGSAVRGEFGRLSPELAGANADYAFFKTLGDVLDPAIGRPKVTAPTSGVTGGAAVSGAVAGAVVGPKAAFVLSVVRPWIQRMKSEPAWQLADAQTKMRLAEAIRNGDLPTAQALMTRIGEGVAITNPSEPQKRTGSAR